MIALNKIRNIYKITFKIVNLTGLRIGSGQVSIDPTKPDNFVMRWKMNTKEIVFIPGSTLKGIFRSTIASLTEDSKCDWHDKAPNKENKEEFLEALKNDEVILCDECRLFGNGFIQGRLLFNDAICEGDFNISIRDGVRIRRDTETAEDKGKYDYEVVDPGCVFNAEITAINVSEKDLELLQKVKDLINLGVIKIGGLKSRGLGRCEIKEWKVESLKEAGGSSNV